MYPGVKTKKVVFEVEGYILAPGENGVVLHGGVCTAAKSARGPEAESLMETLMILEAEACSEA